MGVRRGLAVLLVGVAVVAASGFVTAPGGIGGPTMAIDADGGTGVTGTNAGSDANVDASARLDGPDDTIRAKLRPQTDGAADEVREAVSVSHEFDDVLTADVTGDQYETFEEDPDVEVSPVQRVRLTQSGEGADGNAAPTVEWSTPSGGETLTGETTLRVNAKDPDGSVEFLALTVDGELEAWFSPAGSTTWETMWNASQAPTGELELRAIAEDEDDEVANATIDVVVAGEVNEAPSVSWSAPTDGTTVAGDTELAIDADDLNGSVETVNWRVDGGEARSATYDPDADRWLATWDASAVDPGTYDLTAEAIDDDGVRNRAEIEVAVGDGSPTLRWRSPQDGETVSGSVTVQLVASAPAGEIQDLAWRPDDGEARSATYDDSGYWTADIDVGSLSNGKHTLEARARTQAGATANASISLHVQDDNEPPLVDWQWPVDATTVSGDEPVRLEVSDQDGTIENVGWAVGDEDPENLTHDGDNLWTDDLDTTTLDEGTHELTAGAQDDDGATTFVSVQILVDNDGSGTDEDDSDGDESDGDDESNEVDGSVEVGQNIGDGQPTITWESPTDGETVEPGEVPIRLEATGDGESVVEVLWATADGDSREAERGSGDTWTATWDASSVRSGQHVLEAGVLTESEQVGEATITVTVDGSADGSDDAGDSEDESSTNGETSDGGGSAASSGVGDGPRIPSGVVQIHGGLSSDRPSGGDGVDVAVVDTGVATDHPALRNTLERCVDVVGTRDCEDRHDHGTQVAGIAVADGGDGDGYYGVAPDADLHAYKAVGANGTGYADDVAAAIHDAAENDVEIVVLSLRTEARGSLIEDAIEAHADDLLVVAAAGNDGPEPGSVAPPAAAPSAMAAGAIDSGGRVLENSSRGVDASTFCACAGHLELVAPGQDVPAIRPDGGYSQRSGTSVAAPHVAGAAALAWERAGDGSSGPESATPADVREYLRDVAIDVLLGDGAERGYDPAGGAGMPIVR